MISSSLGFSPASRPLLSLLLALLSNGLGMRLLSACAARSLGLALTEHVGVRTRVLAERAVLTRAGVSVNRGPTWDPRTFYTGPTYYSSGTHALLRRGPRGTHTLFRRDPHGAHGSIK